MAVPDVERIIKADCPGCDAELSLRLPKGHSGGEFAFTCRECGSDQNIVIEPGAVAKRRKRRGEAKVRTATEIEPPLSRKTRLKISAVVLVLAGILGIASSLMTVTGSFAIKDIEDQTRGEYTTLTVSVIDSVTGRPIEDVRIDLQGSDKNHTGYTDPSGLLVISGIRAERETISLGKEGYKSVRSEIVLRKGTPNVLDVPMERGDPQEVIPLRAAQFVPKDYSTLITNVMAMIMFLTSVTAFVSAYLVYRGEFFTLALVGAFLSIFSFGFVLGSVLSLIGTVIITFSYDEFSHTHVLRQLLERNRGRRIIGILKGDR